MFTRLWSSLVLPLPLTIFVFLVFVLLVKLGVIAHFCFFLFRNLRLKVLNVFK